MCAACRIRTGSRASRALTGRDPAVVEYLERHPIVAKMFADIVGFLEHWIPELVRTNRSYLTIAIGCTGGQHRSVYLVERLAQHFSAQLRAGPRATSGRRRMTRPRCSDDTLHRAFRPLRTLRAA